MKLSNRVSLIALSAALSFGFAAAAHAQHYSKLIVFGDSLSDNGNLPPGSAPPAPYVGGRFSNGPVWVEQLGFTLGHAGATGSQDWAFGGARTDTQASPPGMKVQLGGYTGGGGTFTSTTLTTIWGGANNVFQGLPSAGVSPDPFGFMQTTSVSAAADMGFLVNSVATAGGGTILVPNLPKLSATPQFAGNAAAGLADFSVNVFNAALSAQLSAAAAAHPNSNIILMDVYGAGQVVTSNPGIFGFTNVTQSCFNGATVCATPGTYFYWDGVHPTTAGHHLLAELATEYITYGTASAPTAAEGETGMRRRSQAFEASLDHVQARSFTAGEGGVFISIDRDASKLDARGDVPNYKDQATSVRLGVDKALSSNLKLGVQFGDARSTINAGALRFESDSASLDAYAGWRSGSLFVNAVGGAGIDDYKNIRRATAVTPLVNDGATQGWSGGVKVQAGLNLDMGSIVVSPRGAIAWSKGSVDGYDEDGMMVRQRIAGRDTNATTAEGSVRIEAPMGGRFSAYAEAGYRDYVSYSADAVKASLVGNTAQPLSTAVTKPDAGQTILSAGLSGQITDRLSLGVSYRSHSGGGNHEDMGALQLKWRF